MSSISFTFSSSCHFQLLAVQCYVLQRSNTIVAWWRIVELNDHPQERRQVERTSETVVDSPLPFDWSKRRCKTSVLFFTQQNKGGLARDQEALLPVFNQLFLWFMVLLNSSHVIKCIIMRVPPTRVCKRERISWGAAATECGGVRS